jgi:hypothetical protein
LTSQARTFLQQPLLGKTAYAALHFLELLVGPRCQQLQVANPGRYNFDRQALLLSMVQLATQLGKHAEFLQVSITLHCSGRRVEHVCGQLLGFALLLVVFVILKGKGGAAAEHGAAGYTAGQARRVPPGNA